MAEKEAPERVWITWDDAYPWETPESGGVEYVRADLLDSQAAEGAEWRTVAEKYQALVARTENDTAATMRDACVAKVKSIADECAEIGDTRAAGTAKYIAKQLESLTLKERKTMPIFLDPNDLSPGPLQVVPRIPNEDGSIQHVYCEGARFHVISWSTQGRHCSEPDCEINKERKRVAAPENEQERGADTNFPLSDTLKLLVEWAQHLHDSHECDCHGWEQRSFLIEAAQRYQSEIASHSSATTQSSDQVARQITEEIVEKTKCDEYRGGPHRTVMAADAVAAIITKHLRAAAVSVDKVSSSSSKESE